MRISPPTLRDELLGSGGPLSAGEERAGQLDFVDLLLGRATCCATRSRAPVCSASTAHLGRRIPGHRSAAGRNPLLLAPRTPTSATGELSPRPGKLFVVGDPKQSIYRFRRADARLFHRIFQGLRGDGVGTHELKSSTRSTRDIQSFVNAAFENSIANYLPLEGGIEGPAGQPAIVALPMPYPYGTRNISNVKIDGCSPNAVAAFIQWLCNESGWKVRDRVSKALGRRPTPSMSASSSAAFTNFGTT